MCRGARGADQEVHAVREHAGENSSPYEIVTARVHARLPVERVIALPEGVESSEWIYAQLCRIVQDTGIWLIYLRDECRAERESCAALLLERDVYLCPAHGDERQCTAYEYATHTVDSAAQMLQSQRFAAAGAPQKSMRLYGMLCKQLARVYLHMQIHHAALFAEHEAGSRVYARFYALCGMYELYPTEALPAP